MTASAVTFTCQKKKKKKPKTWVKESAALTRLVRADINPSAHRAPQKNAGDSGQRAQISFQPSGKCKYFHSALKNNNFRTKLKSLSTSKVFGNECAMVANFYIGAE